MATLPRNPSAEDYQKFYDSLPENQKAQFLKAGLKKTIESIYTSGIDDVMEDPQPKSGSISSGYFLDNGQRFRFEISSNGTISYNPE